MDLATSLTIPDRYFVLHQSFLSLPQHEYHPTWGYWEDVAVNIAGFIPLGAWAVVCFSSVRAVKWPFLLAILMGFSASVTIEVLQSFLPTRSSGMTDIITNTLGTVIGAMLGSWPIVQDWLARVRQRDDPADCGVRTHAKLETVFSD
jgi:VanZ family protein